MKTLRFIGIVLMTVLTSVTFAACGGDDGELTTEEQTVSYDLYDEPCLEFGCNMARVKAFMDGYSIYNEFSQDEEGYSAIHFYGKKKAHIVSYTFENDKLISTCVQISKIYEKQLYTFLNSKYEKWTITSGDADAFYVSKDRELVIVVDTAPYDENYKIVVYQEH